jgi:hypothetical protein
MFGPHLRKAIEDVRERRQGVERAILRGACADHEKYQKEIGRRQELEHCEAILLDLHDKFFSDQAEGD